MLRHNFHQIWASWVILATLALSSAAKADIGKNERLAIFELTLNEVRHGDILVVFRDKEVLVPVDALRAAGLVAVNGSTEKIKDTQFVSIASVTPSIRLKVDEGASTLRLTAPPEMFSSTVIDLRRVKAPDIEYHTDTSAFINYSWTLKDLVDSSGFVEAGVSFNGALLSTTVSGSAQVGVVRGISNIIYDDRKHLARITIGDAFVSSGELGAGQFIGGLSVTKNFSLDPYFIRQPSMGYSGSALTPSTLDVYINGARIRSMSIAPGQFQVQNLPVMMGSGNVRYVLRDAFGLEHAVDTRYSLAANQLAKGVSEYTYALGMSRHEMGRESFDYRRIVGLGHHRLGLTDKLTLGFRLEGRTDLASGGATLQLVFPYGHASISGAASGGKDGNGAAAVARLGIWTRKFMMMAMAQATTARYSTASLEAMDDRNLLDARFSIAVSPTSRFSFSTDSGVMVPRDEAWQFRIGGSMNVRLANRMQLQVGAIGLSSSRNTSGEVFGMLSYSFDNGIIASMGGRAGDSNRETFASISKPMAGPVDMGYRASGTLGTQMRGDAAVEMQGTQGRFLASVMADERGPHATFQASGAVVAVKGAGIFVTRPVQNGFAVLQVPGIKGVRGYLENQEIGKTDEDGNLIVPNLLAYYGSRVRVTAEDIPLDRQVDEIERIISPPLRGGALVRFSAKRMRLYRGYVQIAQNGQSIIPSYGEIEVSRGVDKYTSPIGKDGAFELADLISGRHRAQITYAQGTCSFDLDAIEGRNVIVNLGTLVCPATKKDE